ncbi:MAG: O-acetylhomoserine aminocarboxypropyltransferase/cysteine synthase family protein [Eubacteriales bacterium]
MKFETKCLHEGYEPGNGDTRVVPIYQSTTYKYDSAEHIGKLFDLAASGHMYSRISNPTLEAVEAKIAALEGGVGAMLTSSGQAALLLSLLNILNAGDHFISTSSIYGGAINLFAVTMKKMGIEVTFVNQDDDIEKIISAFKPNTKAVFAETLSNPLISVLDIEKFVKIAHDKNVPLIVDNTFATPYLCRPIEFGADIVVHSTTKYMDGHAVQIGGVIVDSGNFDWEKAGYTELCTPDKSYHGVTYTKDFGKAAYIVKARVQLLRDIGATMSPLGAFLLNLGIETLPLRMERHSLNALKVAEFLQSSDKIESVNYPGLKGDKYFDIAKKYLPKGSSGVISFSPKGGKADAVKFMDSLKLASLVVHVADIRTCALHPASATHRQLTEEQLKAAGIGPGLIRFSVGLENIDDIIKDVSDALSAI